MNCNWSMEELETHLPGNIKRYIAKNAVNFYTIDAVKIAQEIGLGGRINNDHAVSLLQTGGYIPLADAVKYLKEAVDHSYGLKGQAILDMNYAAIDRGVDAIVKIDVPAVWLMLLVTPISQLPATNLSIIS